MYVSYSIYFGWLLSSLTIIPLDSHLLFEFLNVHSLTGSDIILPSVERLCVGKGTAWGSPQILRCHIPPFFGLLLGLVLALCLLPSFAWRSNSILVVDRLARIEVLNKLVHLGDPFVIFLKASNLAIQ